MTEVIDVVARTVQVSSRGYVTGRWACPACKYGRISYETMIVDFVTSDVYVQECDR